MVYMVCSPHCKVGYFLFLHKIWHNAGAIWQKTGFLLMTFNHWVQGSSPCGPTKIYRGFPRFFIFVCLAKNSICGVKIGTNLHKMHKVCTKCAQNLHMFIV